MRASREAIYIVEKVTTKTITLFSPEESPQVVKDKFPYS
jgi:hypothetical protein